MSDKPILFNGEMVRALLDGRKTQTRRICKLKDIAGKSFYSYGKDALDAVIRQGSPFGVIGDLVWVRETFCSDWGDVIVYKADDPSGRGARDAGYSKEPKYKPSIHMPRLASRITLKITNVRVERLQDISEEDAKAEGVDRVDDNFGNGAAYCDYLQSNITNAAEWYSSPIKSFESLWNSIYNNWHDNPWVWVYDFEVIKANIDDVT